MVSSSLTGAALSSDGFCSPADSPYSGLLAILVVFLNVNRGMFKTVSCLIVSVVGPVATVYCWPLKPLVCVAFL